LHGKEGSGTGINRFNESRVGNFSRNKLLPLTERRARLWNIETLLVHLSYVLPDLLLNQRKLPGRAFSLELRFTGHNLR
jgi:hypothetical protein